MSKLSTLLLWPVVAGTVVALAMLSLFPDGLGTAQQTTKTVPVQETSADLTAPLSYAPAVQRAAPAVVSIYSRRQAGTETPTPEDSPQPSQRGQSSLGSGVIVSGQGYLLTNNHVVTQAEDILIALQDGRETRARVIGTDPETDIALLKVSLPDLPVITFGSSDMLQVGDVVLAIGNPFGVGQTVTQGIVSATGRNRLGINTYENFIQTDAAINPGNSGGALIDAHGNMVGLNTAIFSRSGGSQGIGFAIPADLARRVMDSILAHGRMVRGWLGIEAQEMTQVLAESFGLEEPRGLVIAGVFRSSPAHLAGLRPGDILLEIDGSAVNGAFTAMNRIARTPPGQRIKLGVLRDGRLRTLEVEIAERPKPRSENPDTSSESQGSPPS